MPLLALMEETDMNIITFKTEGLAHISYIVSSRQDAAVIDPRRDINDYIVTSREKGLRIRYVLETHRNEDMVSGGKELGEVTGAVVYHGGQLDFHYGSPLSDGQLLPLGDLSIRAIHTPGHTPESYSFVVEEEKGPVVIFTGDTMFVGEVGRTDLAGPDHRVELSRSLYHSIHNRILPLGDSVLVFPAHGSGSVCGHSIAERELSTIGLEKRDNFILSLDEESFIHYKLEEAMGSAPYFKNMERLNMEGPSPVGATTDIRALNPNELANLQGDGALILDIRYPQEFSAAHIPGAVNILKEGLAPYAGFVIPPGSRLVLVAQDTASAILAAIRLRRIGYDDILGYLFNSLETWIKQGRPLASMESLTPRGLKARIDNGESLQLVDVREAHETASGQIPGARTMPLEDFSKTVGDIDKDLPAVYYCGSGYRGATAASIMLARGFENTAVLLGGVGAWKAAGFELSKQG